MRNLSFFLPVLLILNSCQPSSTSMGKNHAPSSWENLSWLPGEWEMSTPEGTLTEAWFATNEAQWTGSSYLTSPQGDTLFKEDLRLNVRPEGLAYVARVPNQNNGEEVVFMEIESTPDRIIFENIKHDFPQRITYQKISDSTMVATIEGEVKGFLRQRIFNYIRE